MEKPEDTKTAAVGSQLDGGVRPLAGVRKGERVPGDRRNPPQRMTMHWMQTPHKRMYWCSCMPAFRVGTDVHYPRDVKGTGVPKRRRRVPANFVAESFPWD